LLWQLKSVALFWHHLYTHKHTQSHFALCLFIACRPHMQSSSQLSLRFCRAFWLTFSLCWSWLLVRRLDWMWSGFWYISYTWFTRQGERRYSKPMLRWLCCMSYHLFSFCGSLQDYEIHMDTEIVNIVCKSNKQLLNWSQYKSVQLFWFLSPVWCRGSNIM